MNPIQLTVFGVVGVLMFGLFCVRTWLNPAMEFENWGVRITEDEIYLTADPDMPRLRRSSVIGIREFKHGLILRGDGASSQLFIPAGVEEYGSIRNELLRWVSENRAPTK